MVTKKTKARASRAKAVRKYLSPEQVVPPAPPAPPKVAIGRVVHYRLPTKWTPQSGLDGVRPAIIVRTWGNENVVQLAVFLDKPNDSGCDDYASSATHESQAPAFYPDGPDSPPQGLDLRGTWYWPPRV